MNEREREREMDGWMDGGMVRRDRRREGERERESITVLMCHTKAKGGNKQSFYSIRQCRLVD